MRVYAAHAISHRGHLIEKGAPLNLIFTPADRGNFYVQEPGQETPAFPIGFHEWDLVPEVDHAQGS